MIFVFVLVTSFSMIISRSIHVAANGIVPFFFYDCIIFHCIYVPHLYLFLSVDIWVASMSWLL